MIIISKFFVGYIEVILDDSQISQATGWSSQKILDEIIQHRVTKFEELSDVNVVNKQDKQVVIYSEDEDKFTTMDIGDIGENRGLNLNQISKMGITGSVDTPYEVDIPINTIDFKVPRVNVLKWQPSAEQDVIKTLNSFSNSELNDFEPDDMIVFDDTAHLKTEFEYQMQYIGDIGTDNKEYGCEIDKSIFKNIDDIQEEENGVDKYLILTAIPLDRLLIASGDKDLSYVDNIDYFKITGSGGNLKIIASVDSGVTWKTFNADHWEDINLTVDDVKAKGIDISTFNVINSTYWNLLNTNKKIRFAYLFSLDDIADIENVDNLDLEYDGKGKWLEVKESEYDVEYASNTVAQVFLKFSGDVKINY
ncbi:signal peptidase II [Clostridium sp. MT-14]|uniref:signal peptidase II n=1 Tax=Clostridium sp. MT-14 TaxID=3348360 RepID=UPI0035F24344